MYFMKIYTKKGDGGTTSLIGGTRVPKSDLRIESYGTVDELNAYIGLVCDQEIRDHHKQFLREIQETLFIIGAKLASDPGKAKMSLPDLKESDTERLEKEMDRMNEHLPELKNFILPGGKTVVSYCHIARCVCRRAERLVVRLSQTDPADQIIIKYLNRLSDYLFVLARKLSAELGAGEFYWITDKSQKAKDPGSPGLKA